jgi:4-amino-4-deoxy-L-arabinose transferase-like glycosyltransferase
MSDNDTETTGKQARREHHYAFAHQLLRDAVEQEPETYYRLLTTEPEQTLALLWQKAGELAPPSARLSAEGLGATRHTISDERSLLCVRLPAPVAVTEAYFVGIVLEGSAGESGEGRSEATKGRCGRYYTLELASPLDPATPGPAAMLCAWERGAHLNMGPVLDVTEAGFLREVSADVQAKAAPPSVAAPSAPEAPDDDGEPPPRGRLPMIKTDWRHGLALVVICCGIYLPVMGSYGMFDPWETHYTEVARQFMVRDDWLSTYWHNGKGPEGWSETNFWTKPVGSFWLSGLSLRLFGYSGATTGEQIATGHIEWAVRLPFFLCALFGAYCIYLLLTRLVSRRCGLVGGIITATAPMYFSIGRQAMTDMPYVGLMSGGLALFALSLLGEKEPLPRRSIRLGKRELSFPVGASYFMFLAAFLITVGLQMRAIIPQLLRVPLPFHIAGRPISAALIMGIYIAIAAVFIFWSRKTKTTNEVYLYTFYLVVGIAGLAKGLIGALQPGLIILMYLLTSQEWRLLTDVALARGLAIAVVTFVPWFHAMLARYGMPFWNELFGTEQFRRLTIGEQAQAKGTFEYYVSQVGYGLYPWVAFLPAALARVLKPGVRRAPRERLTLFVMTWFATAMALFGLTITKYHHYILPAIPPAAILIALYLEDLVENRVRGAWIALLTGFGLLAILTLDMVKQPARWVWMYTYLYEQVWAQGVPKGIPILIWGSLTALTLFLFFFRRLRRVALWLTVAVAVLVGGYVQNWYQLTVAPHYSQKKVITSYYKLRKGPEEELVAWQFNWRGETWYSGAECVVSKSLDNTAIIQYLREHPNRRFFFITERGRYSSLSAILPTEKGRRTLKLVDDTNVHYVLAQADI